MTRSLPYKNENNGVYNRYNQCKIILNLYNVAKLLKTIYKILNRSDVSTRGVSLIR